MAKSAKNKIRSAVITKVFMNIPMAIENPTKPFLYSFFQGLKQVFTRIGREINLRKELFKEAKKISIVLGASRNQNFKKIKGSDK